MAYEKEHTIKLTVDPEIPLDVITQKIEAEFEALGRRLSEPGYVLETEETWGIPWWLLVAAGAIGGLAALLVVVIVGGVLM